MKRRFTLPVQWSVTLLLGLFLGYAYQPLPEQISAPSPSPATAVSTPFLIPSAAPTVLKPYETLPGGWLVRVRLFRDAAPQIEKVVSLKRFRLADLPAGENRVELLSDSGDVLFTQSFSASFLRGEPPQPVDSQTLILTLPSVEGAREVAVITKNGKASYALPAR